MINYNSNVNYRIVSVNKFIITIINLVLGFIIGGIYYSICCKLFVANYY
ncbi:hypothetical protein KYB31_06450 [Clostridium felsineum]|nr:hypothetical protein [Clostridium felsineum]MCR3758635.1 hypothetical protein [Clostridium felsineum]